MICNNCGSEYDGYKCDVCGFINNKKSAFYRKPAFWIIVFLLIIIIVLISVIISKNSNVNSQSDVSTSEKSTSTDEVSKNTGNVIVDKVNDESNGAEQELNENSNVEFQSISVGDKINLDFVEMSVDKIAVADELYPSNPSGYYRYYEDVNDEKYIYLKGSIKNISNNQYDISDIYASVKFDNKYTYTCWLLEDEGSDLNYISAWLNPMKQTNYYIYSSIPNSVIESYSTCEVCFGFKKNFSESNLSISDCDYLYRLSAEK